MSKHDGVSGDRLFERIHDNAEDYALRRLDELLGDSLAVEVEPGKFVAGVPGGNVAGSTRDEAIMKAALFSIYYLQGVRS